MSFHSRNLPHWIPENASIFLTWRLYGSLNFDRSTQARVPVPQGKKENESAGQRFRRMDMRLDRMRGGVRWLENPSVAAKVEQVLLRGEECLRQYRLHAYVLMPNHVHILISPSISVSRIMRGIKGVSARDANRILRRSGKLFWQDESYDHWVRSEQEFWRIVAYIENNPVSAHLVSKPEKWKWSSAALKTRK
jgi:REP element-mobilizing transposase RayT